MNGPAARAVEFELRPACTGDIDALVQLSTGPIAGKHDYLCESLERRHVTAACHGARVVGYSVWDRAFFGRPFVWLLGVDAAYRRQGIGLRLMRAAAQCCRGETLFTSTNESNAAMRSLLHQLGFELSGRIENLDVGDPELIFSKAAVAMKGV